MINEAKALAKSTKDLKSTTNQQGFSPDFVNSNSSTREDQFNFVSIPELEQESQKFVKEERRKGAS